MMIITYEQKELFPAFSPALIKKKQKKVDDSTELSQQRPGK